MQSKTFEKSTEILFYIKNLINRFKYRNNHELNTFIQKCENLLEYDKQGYLKKIYYEACKSDNTLRKKKDYLVGMYNHLTFKDTTLEFDIDFLSNIEFHGCNFKNILIKEQLKEFYQSDFNLGRMFNTTNHFTNIEFLNTSDLRYNNVVKKRIGSSHFTCHVNLYVELDRICNAKCSFCRNQYYAKCAYDFKKIKKLISNTGKTTDTVVIGGGEPTLKYNELKKLVKNRYKNNMIISSNLSADPKKIIALKDYYNYNFLVSRHAIDSEENASIFGFNEKLRNNSEKNLHFLGCYSNNTLSTVCYAGGINNMKKLIDYIEWGIEKGYSKFLIQTLHTDNSVGINEVDLNSKKIDTQFIERVMTYFINKKYFQKKDAIYSTAGYKSTVLKKKNMSIAFKEYLSKDDFEKEFPTAIKRTIDLSIAPDGTLYENWHQNSGAIEIPKRKILLFKKDL